MKDKQPWKEVRLGEVPFDYAQGTEELRSGTASRWVSVVEPKPRVIVG